MSAKPLKDFILEWNIRFKYDRIWRKKYNIPFGSEQHRNISQIDIYLDLLEDRTFAELEEQYLQLRQGEEELKQTGKFLKERKLTLEEEQKMLQGLRNSIKNG